MQSTASSATSKTNRRVEQSESGLKLSHDQFSETPNALQKALIRFN